MFNHRSLAALILLGLLAVPARPQERDLRQVYGTRSLEAAKLVHQAAQHLGAKKFKEALAAAEAAVKVEPTCQRAHFIKALALGDLGDIEKSIDAYKVCLSDAVERQGFFSSMAATNIGLTLGKLKEYDESNRWFTRALMEDYA